MATYRNGIPTANTGAFTKKKAKPKRRSGPSPNSVVFRGSSASGTKSGQRAKYRKQDANNALLPKPLRRRGPISRNILDKDAQPSLRRTPAERKRQTVRGPVGGAVAKARKTIRKSPTSGASGASGASGRAGSGSGGSSGVSSSRPSGSAATRNTAPSKSKAPKTTANPEAAADKAEEQNPFAAMYKAAYRELDRQQQMVDARLAQRQETQRAFDAWVAQQRGTATNHLTSQYEQLNKAALDQQQAVAAAASARGSEAARQAGQSGADALALSGADANQQSAGQYADVDRLYAGNPMFTQADALTIDANQAKVDQARAANMMREWQAMHGREAEAVNQSRNETMRDEVKTNLDWTSKQQAAELERTLADWAMNKDQQELEIARTNAITERIKVTNAASAAKRRDQLTAMIAEGKLGYQQARLAYDRDLAGANLTLREREVKLKEFEARGGKVALNKANDLGQKTVSDYLERAGVASVDAIRGGSDNGGAQRIALGRTVANQMRAVYPNMTQSQALRLLGGMGFAAGTRPPTKDARLLNHIRANFRAG